MTSVGKTKEAKADPAVAAIEKVTGKTAPYKRVLVSNCLPNPWNPNKMGVETREKLVRGIDLLRSKVGVIPPIVVRPHPDPKQAKWQIIDGFHRWDIYREKGEKLIDAYIVDVDDATAMLLTDMLNYLRGEPDPELHAKYLQQLMTTGRMPVDKISEYLPQTADELQGMLDAYDLHVDVIEVPKDADTSEDGSDAVDVNFTFMVSRSQAAVIEQELTRIGALLPGKNVRGRALEMMAVNSSLTPAGNLTGEPEEAAGDDQPLMKPLRKSKKKRAA